MRRLAYFAPHGQSGHVTYLLVPETFTRRAWIETITERGRMGRLFVHPQQVLEITGKAMQRILTETLRQTAGNVPADVLPCRRLSQAEPRLERR